MYMKNLALFAVMDKLNNNKSMQGVETKIGCK